MLMYGRGVTIHGLPSRGRTHLFARAAARLAWGLLAACSTTVEPVTDPGRLRSLGFLQEATVSRQEVEGRLGSPWYFFEAGRIVIYVLRAKGDAFEVAQGGGNYRLVLVYRPDDVVARWSLVDVAH